MTEQKRCETCCSWNVVVKSAAKATSEGGEFPEPEQKSGFCIKLNEAKSAYDTCDDWKPKNR